MPLDHPAELQEQSLAASILRSERVRAQLAEMTVVDGDHVLQVVDGLFDQGKAA
jgi:hypothetical protein